MTSNNHNINHTPPPNSGFEKTIDNDIKDRLWEQINENTQLKQENFYLRTKIKQIEQILNETKTYLNDVH